MTTTHIMSDETGQQILAQLDAIQKALNGGALTNEQISTVLSNGTATGDGKLDAGGLKVFFDGLKQKFAALKHNHSGDALAPASVTASGTVKAATIEDSGGTLAALRESVSLYGITKTNINLGNITIGPEGYYLLPSDVMPSGSIVFVSISGWASMTPAGCISFSREGPYIMGAANTVVKNLRIDVFTRPQ